mgnify:FL=1|tara:strand:+ start:148 stop:501 length:354 start_codon:yes stop_codon:yes gene_type:complete
MTEESKTTHEEIMACRDTFATPKQCNYLVFLYKDILKASILKSHKSMDKTNDWVNFGGKGDLKGKIAINFYNTFIPANAEFTKNKVSALIHEAKNNQKFDKAFAKSLIASVNSYKKS